ncbi:MAG: LysE family transporter [Burkholderiaceae bacterium]
MVSPAFPLFAEALWVGFSIAAPVGPIGLLTIQRTLERGVRVGLATGLGAATADALYGALGALGTRFLIDALVGARTTLALFGGLVLLAMAWRVARQPLDRQAAAVPTSVDLLGCFAGTLALTLSNPVTILSFIAIFGAMAGGARTVAVLPMVAGVWLGSALWWLLLATLVARWRARLHDAWRLRIQWGSAALLAGFALWQWWGLLR